MVSDPRSHCKRGPIVRIGSGVASFVMSRSLAISLVTLCLASCVIHHEQAPAAPAPEQASKPTPAKKKQGKKKRHEAERAETAEPNAARDDVKVVKVKRRDPTAPRRTTPAPREEVLPEPTPTPVPTPTPNKKPKREKPGDRTGIRVACNFEQGFVSVLPADVYDPGEEFLMQALIGLAEESTFWMGMPEYAKLEPYKASRCTNSGRMFNLAPGKYVVAVGMAGQFKVRNEYRDKGFLTELVVTQGEVHQVALSTSDLKHTWRCISCPWLVVFRDGERVEAGQVLVDRYTRRRYGTDVVTTRADVVDGVLVVRIEEREPEVSFIDAVVVRAGGRALRPLRRTPKAMRAIDDQAHALRLGEAVELRFDARGLADGPVDVEIEVSGHYEPIGPLL